ncbi:OmpW/AlkL family protein [Acinetobacter sp. MD2]|uniref:OmpW/AlkL family protein n=1 Tax=Acinetobacter sp. MD2 TaxID=2600066 RepID=UPI002D1E7B01|nr:OmpW family outer membrane protein [Acinetobacter sp. MD2]MEB3767313.1 outer membrane beta-barrel protein [Acinetobacter sp. MD2]
MLKKLLVLSLLAASSATFAGNWQVKVGGSVLAPSKDDNTLANGLVTNAKADHAFSFTPSVEYFFGESGISTELLLATPFKHDVTASVAGGNSEKIASFKHLPPTLTVKYNFKNSTGFTPYVGVGATAVIIWGEETKGAIEGAKLKADNAYGVAGQVGFNFQPADAKNWGVFADVRYADVSSDLKLNGEKIGTLDVNPWVYTIGYSYRF